MLNKAINARQEGFLHAWVNDLVRDYIGSEGLVKEKMESLSNAATNGNHPKILRIFRIPLLLDELHHRFTPGGRGEPIDKKLP